MFRSNLEICNIHSKRKLPSHRHPAVTVPSDPKAFSRQPRCGAPAQVISPVRPGSRSCLSVLSIKPSLSSLESSAVRWLWWPCVTLWAACWANQPALALSIRGAGRSTTFPITFTALCCSYPSRSTWPPVETIISATRWVQYVDEALGPGSKRKVKGLRWLRAAAESDQSEAAGWREMPPPVGTRKKLTLTPARFRAQIDGSRLRC